MSRLYDAAEPGVIDEELLSRLVIEQGPQKEAGRIARAEGIEFTEVLHLRLDFKNIQQLENLWQFCNLTKLQLDNNIISDIKGLDRLVHLQWLDLSFNNIKDVTGLNCLVNLRDLSLAHNLIQRVNGLGSLRNLQVLSLGFNQLNNLKDTVLYLRTITSLETLCLKGNEFSPVPPHDEETRDAEMFRSYQTVCLAYLPDLLYLDYRMISKEARMVASEQHEDDLIQLMAEEKQEKVKKEEERKLNDWLQLLDSAYMNGIGGEDFYDSLFEEDTDAAKLSVIPGEKKRLEKYHETVVKTAEEILAIGLAEKEKRDLDREAFLTAHRRALENNQRQSVEKIEKYEREKADLLKNSQFELFGEKITDLQYELMKLEMILVEQLDEMIKDFDRSYNEMISGFIEKIQALTTQLRDLEKERHEALTEDVTVLLDMHVKGHLDENTPEQVILLLSDKDSLLGALNASHDSHMLAIDNKEDGMRNRMNKDSKVLMDDLASKEGSRNRQRIMEIKHYIELQQEEFEDWLNAGVTTE